VAGVSEGPRTFFRLSPVARSEASCFGVRRGEIAGRFDVNYWWLTPLFHERFSNPIYPPTPLGSVVALVQYGCSSLATERPTGTPMLRMNNLQDDGWDLRDLKFIVLTPEEVDRYRVEPGDLLFNRTNSKELVGKCAVFVELGDWVFASYLIRVRLRTGEVLPQFACDFLNTDAGRLQIDRLSRQIIGMTNINAEELKEILLPLPSEARQCELAAAMNAARAARKAKLADADAELVGLDGCLLQALGLNAPPKDDRKMFAASRAAVVAGGRFDPGFHHPRYARLLEAFFASPVEKRPLGAISPDIVGGATPTKGSIEFYADRGVKFFRILNVKANEFDLSDLNFIKNEVHSGELKRSQLEENDVLMTITGRVGNAAVVTGDLLPANINQHLVRLRVKVDDVLPEYLAVYLNSSIGLALSNRGVTGGTRVALDYGTIRALLIPVPARHIQEEIASETRKRRDEARRLRAEAQTEWQAAKHWLEAQLLGGT
jgi:type I restriction enzyme, S subunit